MLNYTPDYLFAEQSIERLHQEAARERRWKAASLPQRQGSIVQRWKTYLQPLIRLCACITSPASKSL